MVPLGGEIHNVFTRLNAVAFINFEQAGGSGLYSRAALIRGRHLFEGGAAYLRAALIRGRRLFEGGAYYYDLPLCARSALIRSGKIDEHGCSRQSELGHGQSRRRLQTM